MDERHTRHNAMGCAYVEAKKPNKLCHLQGNSQSHASCPISCIQASMPCVESGNRQQSDLSASILHALLAARLSILWALYNASKTA